jgi:hypothetical protein
VISTEPTNKVLTPAALLNLAWHNFEADQAAYRSWERAAIADFLERH